MSEELWVVIYSFNHPDAGWVQRAEGPCSLDRARARRNELWDTCAPGEAIPVEMIRWVRS